uniref:Putative ovule protein n=1 Tax=Solanum chacoense TaxID=4108 RepID=A0A0V0HL71_SOLCH
MHINMDFYILNTSPVTDLYLRDLQAQNLLKLLLITLSQIRKIFLEHGEYIITLICSSVRQEKTIFVSCTKSEK